MKHAILMAILLSVPAAASLRLVQSAQAPGNGGGTSTTLTYHTAPSPGNLLVVAVGSAFTASAPSGWTVLGSASMGGEAFLSTFIHVVGASESNSYTFSQAGSDNINVVGYEIAGQSASQPDRQGTATVQNVSSVTSPAKTPSVVLDLALTFWVSDHGSSAVSAVSPGWTLDQYADGGWYRPLAAASRNSLTTDTVTSISNTFTLSSQAVNNAMATVLIAPSLSTGTPPAVY